MGDPYPYQLADASDAVTWSDAARENFKSAVLKHLVHAFPTFKVDPNNSECHSTLDAAWANANANLPAGVPAVILLADGTYSDDIDFGTARPIILIGTNYRGAEISGDVTLGAKSAVKRHHFYNLRISGAWSIKDGNYQVFENCSVNGTQFSYDPTAGSVGYSTRFLNCDQYQTRYVESATSSGTRELYIYGGSLGLILLSSTGFSTHKMGMTIAPDTFIAMLNGYAVFDLNSASATIRIPGSIEVAAGVATNLFANAGSASVYWEGCNIWYQGVAAQFGTIGSSYGSPVLHATLEPSSPPTGTVWYDTTFGETVQWDGTYWSCGGGVKRKRVSVAIGTAAASHAVGFTVPAEAVVLSASINAKKALTGAGGADRFGLADTPATPNGYVETTALTKNSKAQETYAPLARASAGGDALYIMAMTAAGTYGGTIAGSNADDVDVLIYFRVAQTLPST